MSEKVYAFEIVTCMLCAGDGEVIVSTKPVAATMTGIPAQTREAVCPTCRGTGVVRITVIREPEPPKFVDRKPYTSRSGHTYVPR